MASIRSREYTWTLKDGSLRTGVKYQATFYDRAGREHRKLFRLKKEAQRWIDEQTTATVSGLWVEPKAGAEKFGAYAQRWLKRQLVADNTQDQYERFVRLHTKPLNDLRLDELHREDIQLLVNAWDKEFAPATVHAKYGYLSIILKAAVKDRVIAVSPCVDISLSRLDPPTALVPITTANVAALRTEMTDIYRLFVVIGAGTGMRRGEILGLTRDRLAPTFGRIRVDRQLSTKSTAETPVWGPPKTAASTRNIDTAEFVFDAIDAHIDKYGVHKSGLILRNTIGSVLVPSTLHRAWTLATGKVGIDATPHDLRHYFASQQLAAGTSIKKLQEMLGHQSATETLDTYSHLMGDEGDRAKKAMANSLGKALKNHPHKNRTSPAERP